MDSIKRQSRSDSTEYEIAGDNLEIQMIKISKTKIKKDGTIQTNDGKNIKILRVYEFDSNVKI